MRKFISFLSLGLAAFGAMADGYPTKPITFVVQYAAGSGADELARMIADAVQRGSEAQFIVKNMPGAQAVVGTTNLVRSPADGYTVGICSSSVNSIANSLFKSLPYDTNKDFTFIAPLATYTYVVTASPQFASFDALAKEATGNPGKLSYGYSNATGQVLSAALNKKLGVQALAVPYKATQDGLTDMAENRVSYGVTDMGPTVAMVKAGRVKALAVLSPKRSPSLPDVPSLVELGRPPLEVTTWAGMCGPKNMPPEAVAWLRERIQKAMNDKTVLDRYTLLGLEPLRLTDTSFPDFVAAQQALWTSAAKDANIRAE